MKFLNYRILSDKTHCAVVEQNQSIFQQVIGGVLQGRTPGPILFFVFINDIDSVHCGDAHLRSFAGDAKLYS
jgi:hypothetical protein